MICVRPSIIELCLTEEEKIETTRFRFNSINEGQIRHNSLTSKSYSAWSIYFNREKTRDFMTNGNFGKFWPNKLN
jgi:hypothetical protein